jgi:hypothetical protein
LAAYDLEDCVNKKKEALTTILDSMGGVSAECDDFIMEGTLLTCFAIDAGNDGVDAAGGDGGDVAQPVTSTSQACSIAKSVSSKPSKWYGEITVGFDAASAVIDFTGTAIDPSTLGDIWVDTNVFTSIEIVGRKVTLIAKTTNRWFSSTNKSKIHFSSKTGKDKLEKLYTSGLPKCAAY